MIYSFPKIWQLETRNVQTIFDSEVEISEKIDGSHFNFGIIDGTLHMRSRGADIVIDHPEKMFKLAVDYVLSIQEKLLTNIAYHCEFLNRPKHNVIQYNRVPKNNLICFGVSDSGDTFGMNHRSLAEQLDIEPIPILFKGMVTSMEQIEELMETESILGGHKVEGIVIKNYNQQVLVGGFHQPIMTAKYVSEAFKEKHNAHKPEFSGKGRLETLIQSYRTEARWNKAVQHLREQGLLTETPKDIGSLMKEVHRDLGEECKEEIMEALWKEFSKKIKRVATAGMANWYKEFIAIKHFPKGGKE